MNNLTGLIVLFHSDFNYTIAEDAKDFEKISNYSLLGISLHL